ncbi:MAG: stage II sporulation protein R [Oscillospiraceae bacterium]
MRLHVIAVSDDDAEQAVKLQVRDAVLAYLEPQLAERDGHRRGGADHRRRPRRHRPRGADGGGGAAGAGRRWAPSTTRRATTARSPSRRGCIPPCA